MKRAILKINTSKNIEVFTSLETLFKKHESLRKFKYNIKYQISRLKHEYKATDFVIRRVVIDEA